MGAVATKTWVELLLSYGATGLLAIAVVAFAWLYLQALAKVERLYEARVAEAKAYTESYQKLLLVCDRLAEMVEDMRTRPRR